MDPIQEAIINEDYNRWLALLSHLDQSEKIQDLISAACSAEASVGDAQIRGPVRGSCRLQF